MTRFAAVLCIAVATAACVPLRPPPPPPIAMPASSLLAAGTRWETPVFVRDSHVPGPTVLVVGGMHGDERAGWQAAESIAAWDVTSGRLIVVPRANRIGVDHGTRSFDWGRDLNRAFSHGKPHGPLAAELWALVRREKPAWMIDLHEAAMHADLRHPHSRRNSAALGESVLWSGGAGDEAATMAALVAGAASDDTSRFLTTPMGIPSMLTQSAAATLGVRSLLVETWTDRPIETRRDQHRRATHALLESLGMLPRPD